jgi:hypothetical protein
MALDPSIITNAMANWQQPEDPLARFAKIQALKNGITQQQVQQQQLQTGALDLQQKQQAVTDQQGLNNAFKSAYAPDPSTGRLTLNENALYQNMAANGLGSHIPTVQKSIQDANEAAVKFKQTQTAANEAAQDYLAQQLLYVKDAKYDPTTFTSTLAAAVSHGAVPPAAAAQLNQQFQQNPTSAGVQSLIDPLIAASPKVQDVLTKRATASKDIAQGEAATSKEAREAQTQLEKEADAALQNLAGANAQNFPALRDAALTAQIKAGRSPSAIPGAFTPDGQDAFNRSLLTAEQRTTAAVTQARDAATQKYRDSELENAAARLGIERQRLYSDKDETQLTPEARDKMAEMFATTGQLPAMGMGKSAGAVRSQIMNRAAELYPNVQFATNRAAFQANSQSLKQAQTRMDQVTAAETTAGKNLDVFLDSAKKVVDSGSPWINQPLRAVSQQGLGSSDMAAYNAARQTAIAEISKVLNNPQGGAAVSDSARKEVEGLIGPNASLSQVYAAANILKTDMKNRHDAYQQQIDSINGRIGSATGTGPAGGAGAGTGAPKATKRYNPKTGQIEAAP